MTTEAKVRPINRLKSMYALRALVDKMYDGGREAEKEGRPVAWCMVAIPTPILTTMGIETVFPENYGTVCASSGAAASFLEHAEAEGFPSHLCGYCRNGLGYAVRMADLDGQVPPEAPGAGLPKPTFMVASGATCDARYKFFQATARYLDVPIFTLEAPSPGLREAMMEGAHERHINFMVKEYKELAAFLENLTGKKMDWDKLVEAGEKNRELDAVWWETNELRQARPGPMHSRDFWSAMFGVMYKQADAKVMTSLYRDMYDEVKDRVDNKIAGINREERYRLSFQGLPPWHSLGFFDRLAERGWNFVHESSYHPSQPVEAVDVSHISDPVERYVRRGSREPTYAIDRDFEPEEAASIKEEVRRTGYSWRLGIKHIREHQCDGVFIHPPITCRAVTAPLYLYQKQLMEVYKVPSLVVEGDIVDLTLFNPEEALRKAEAFEETMDYYREVRKKEGLEW